MPKQGSMFGFQRVTFQPQAAPEPVRVGAHDHVLEFSRGNISRKAAMQRLGIGYSELLDLVAARSLPLPRVNDAQAQEMADTLLILLETQRT